MAGVDLDLVIGDRLVAQFELPDPVVVLVVPLLGRFAESSVQ